MSVREVAVSTIQGHQCFRSGPSVSISTGVAKRKIGKRIMLTICHNEI